MSESLLPPVPLRPCSYCGREVRADYYFCPACSKPWRPGDVNLGPTPEPVWDAETQVRLKAPEAYQLFFIYLAAVILAAVAAQFIEPGRRTGLATFVLNGIAVLGVTLWAGLKYRAVLGPILRRPGITHPLFIPGLVLGAALIGINFLYHGWLQQFLHGQDEAEHFGEGLTVRTAFVLVCLIPAVTEEIGFRGLMQTILLRALPPRKAIILSALLFAAAHFTVLSFPYLFLVGALLGWLLHRTGSIYPGIIIHAAHNLVVVLHFHS
jgi:uncharacterized protein